jgi:hypothetical protein
VFRANLARGAYGVEVNVFDVSAQAFVAQMRPAVQFTVTEDITYNGIANLFMSAELLTPVSA